MLKAAEAGGTAEAGAGLAPEAAAGGCGPPEATAGLTAAGGAKPEDGLGVSAMEGRARVPAGDMGL